MAALDRPSEARSKIDAIIRGPYMDHHVAYSLGATFAQLRRSDEAVTWLRTAIDEGFPCYPWFVQDPMLDPIRTNDSYRGLMRELEARFAATRARYGARQVTGFTPSAAHVSGLPFSPSPPGAPF